MVFNSKENGNAIFHIYRGPDGKYELINVPLLWENRDLLKYLLQVDTLGMDDLESPEGRLYMVLHDGSSSKPYSSVMIWRYECQGKDRRIVDVEEKDLRAVVFVREYFMDRGAQPSTDDNK